MVFASGNELLRVDPQMVGASHAQEGTQTTQGGAETIGGWAGAAPGTTQGWCTHHIQYGSISWNHSLAPWFLSQKTELPRVNQTWWGRPTHRRAHKHPNGGAGTIWGWAGAALGTTQG